MMKRIFILTLLSILSCTASLAQEDSLKLENPKKKTLINDYSMIGVNYGYTFSTTYFTPSKYGKKWVVKPNYVSLTYTKYSKMFDYLPYFGVTVGVAYGHEGYAFETEDKEYPSEVDGATWCSMDVIEVPALMQIHADFEPFKVMANLGIYGGWRRSIERTGLEGSFDRQYSNKFRDYEHRFDYGFQGGVGFALMFDPVEIHFNCLVRWAWSNLYDPDYASKYYYRYAYPIDIMATVGLHFQLTKRKGRTTKDLRREAYDKVYGKNGNTESTDR